jgi:thioredoxin reductase (NADPH)
MAQPTAKSETDLHAATCPQLSEEQLRLLDSYGLGTHKRYAARQKLIEVGDHHAGFFIVLSGQVEVVAETDSNELRRVTMLRRGEFTGEAANITCGPSFVSYIARTDCEVLEMSVEALRQLINQQPSVGDILLQAFIARRHILRESGSFRGLRVIGSRFSRDSWRVRDFLSKNQVPFAWLDVEEDPSVAELLKQSGLSVNDTPVVALGHNKALLRNPSEQQLADLLALNAMPTGGVCDLAVIGAGPAGLAAAVYAASEGLSVLVFDSRAPGGQAGQSMCIENYLGFPAGITGAELVERAVLQVGKFGAKIVVPVSVTGVQFKDKYTTLQLDNGALVTAKCVLIATGAEYRKLSAAGCEQFEGRGVYYAATPTEAPMCAGADVVVVGGGNSAGQAAVFLSQHSHTVYMLVRGNNLRKDMSEYLAWRLEHTLNIKVLLNTEVQRVIPSERNGEQMAAVLIRTNGEMKELPVRALFSFIGAVPRTSWLAKEIETDAKGFIRTGPSIANSPSWTAKRQPFPLETSRPGVFAAGDVRLDSVKRVASAVGEGAMAVKLLFEHLKDQ